MFVLFELGYHFLGMQVVEVAFGQQTLSVEKIIKVLKDNYCRPASYIYVATAIRALIGEE